MAEVGLPRELATRVLQHPYAQRVVARAAIVRRTDLVLVYHRVGDRRDLGVVPQVHPALFRRHTTAVTRLGDIVPLRELIDRSPTGGRARIALTFDDDYASHVDVVLPLLRDAGLTATFFLSGRRLNGLGRYWWEVLEDLWSDSQAATARLVDLPPGSLATLMEACERDPSRQRRLEAHDSVQPDHVDGDDIRALVKAGMTVGFHTLRHPVLPLLDEAGLARALTEGRAVLEEIVGTTIDLLAYPHGRADARVAAATRAAGFAAAFTGVGDAMSQHGNRHLLSRWEPGGVPAEEMLAKAAYRLLRPARGGR